MFRAFVIAAAVATLPVLSPSALLGQQAPPPAAPMAGPHKPMTLPKPVNLKLLPKDISSEELMKVMRGFSQQLGVKCTFCHAADAAAGHPNFASDTKPEKNTARTMMLMTQEINAKYLSQIHDPDATPDQKTVSCGTCHQGHSMPEPFKAPAHPNQEHPAMDHPATPPKS
jgi:Photosynthetic reaction centre cytochrome C subunit